MSLREEGWQMLYLIVNAVKQLLVKPLQVLGRIKHRMIWNKDTEWPKHRDSMADTPVDLQVRNFNAPRETGVSSSMFLIDKLQHWAAAPVPYPAGVALQGSHRPNTPQAKGAHVTITQNIELNTPRKMPLSAVNPAQVSKGCSQNNLQGSKGTKPKLG